MNIIYLFIATGFVWEVVLSQTPATNTSKLERLIYDRCKRNSENAATYDDVKYYLESFTDFLRVAFSHIPEGKKQFCDDDRSRLIKTAHVLATKLKECFRGEEKYLPKFAYESFVEFLDFLCDDNGRNIDNVFSTFGRDCMQKMKTENAGSEVGHCFSKMVAPFDGKVKKEKLCDDISTAKKCFATTITKHCPDFPAFESLNKKFFKAIQKPCNAASTLEITSLLLLIVAFFSTKTLS